MKRYASCLCWLLILALLAPAAMAEAQVEIPEFTSFSENRFTLVETVEYEPCYKYSYECAYTEETKNDCYAYVDDYYDALTDNGDFTGLDGHYAEYGRFGEYTQNAVWLSYNGDASLSAFTMNLVDVQTEPSHVLLAIKDFESQDKYVMEIFASKEIVLAETTQARSSIFQLIPTAAVAADEARVPDFMAFAQDAILEVDADEIITMELEAGLAALTEYDALLQQSYNIAGLQQMEVDGILCMWYEEYTGSADVSDMVILELDEGQAEGYVFLLLGVSEEKMYLQFAYSDDLTVADTGERFSGAVSDMGNGASQAAYSDNGQSGGDAVLLAKPLSAESVGNAITADNALIQDPIAYFDGAFSYDNMDGDGDFQVRNYSGSKDDFNILEAYVDMLTETNPYLTLYDTYTQSYQDTFFSYGINYTGNVRMDTCGQTHTDNTVNVMIYGSIKRSKLEFCVWIPRQMEITDLGHRYGGGMADTSIGGESALAGLCQLPDGSFQTSDGRLTTCLNEAAILRDGELYTTEATFERDEKGGRDRVWARYFYRNETLHFSYETRSLITGDIIRLGDLQSESSWLIRDNGRLDNEGSLTGYRWGAPFLGANHDGEWVTPVNDPDSAYTDATVRVMYMDADVAVYYIYAEFDSAPDTFEALIAVGLTDADPSEKADYTTYTGQLLTVPFEGRVFGAKYELYDWEIISGASLATISGENSSTVTLQANKPGAVGLRCTYEYGVEEPDVLTGNPRTVNKTKTQDIIIIIN